MPGEKQFFDSCSSGLLIWDYKAEQFFVLPKWATLGNLV
jgi:hypothetical protein